ncbi:MAG: hypothetical protein ACLFST_04280 [Spirochaetia bacterium]
MRKVTLLALILACFTVFGVAAQAEESPTLPSEEEIVTIITRFGDAESRLGTADLQASVSGSATMTFGIDLDNGINGICNSTSSSIKITLVKKSSVEKGAEDADIYGWIKLSNFEITVGGDGTSASAPGVSAHIKLPSSLYINILGSFDKVDKASASVGLAHSISSMAGFNNLSNTYDSECPGVALGYAGDTFSGDIALVSYNDWLNDDDPTINDLDYAYAVSAAASVSAVENLSLSFAANMGFMYDTNPIAFGVATGYTYNLTEEFYLKPSVGFDGVITDGDFDWQVAGGLLFGWPGSTGGKVTMWDQSAAAYSGLGIGVSVLNGEDIDMSVSIYEASGDAGLVPVLGAGILYEIYNLTDTQDMALGVHVNADLGNIYTWAEVSLDMPDAGAAIGTVMAEVGADLKVIPNTTFTLLWDSGDINGTPVDMGYFTFATKISY